MLEVYQAGFRDQIFNQRDHQQTQDTRCLVVIYNYYGKFTRIVSNSSKFAAVDISRHYHVMPERSHSFRDDTSVKYSLAVHASSAVFFLS